MAPVELPITLVNWLAAALPIIALLLILLLLRKGIAQAAPVGIIIALFSAFFIYGANTGLVVGECAKGIWYSLKILYIVFPAIMLYEVSHKASVFSVLRRGLEGLSRNELLQIIAIGWVFVSFLQGVTGFGVPVAVAAPLLIGIGVRPLWAVVISLLGQSWGNTFGTLAVAWDALLYQVNLPEASADQTALWAAILIWIINIILGLAIAWFYGRRKAIFKGFLAIVAISLVQGGGQLVLCTISPTLSNFVPAVLSLLVIFLLGRSRFYNQPWRIETSPMMDREKSTALQESPITTMTLNQAFVPYYALCGLTLVVLLFEPLKRLLGFWRISFSFPSTVTDFGHINKAIANYAPLQPFTDAGTFLLIAAIAGFFFFKGIGILIKSDFRDIMANTLKKTAPSAVAIILLVAMSQTMSGTGQVKMLAQGVASITGKFYAQLSPLVGLLGSFMTSSNMASNILFSSFQKTTASILALKPEIILAGQTAGGALGSILAPGKILLGTTTAGILGSEGNVLRKVIGISIVLVIGLGVIVLVFV